MAWKFLSKRFGMYGEAFQMQDEGDIIRKVKAAGRKHHRRLEGKNGWLWYTIFSQKGRIYNLETDMALNHVRVPVSPKWYHKLILKRLFGYEYKESEYSEYKERWTDDE